MKSKTNIKFPLTDVEKANLRKKNIKITDILDFANTNDTKKTWWDFTEERKKFRDEMAIQQADLKNRGLKYLGYAQKDKTPNR